MPVHINITGEDAAHALRELRGLATGFTIAAEPAPLVAEAVADGEEKTFPEPKKRGRPPKAVEPEMTAVEAKTNAEVEEALDPTGEGKAAHEAAVAAEQDDRPFTLDDARKALGDLLAQPNGKDKAKAVFAEFSATKISDIAEGQIKGFIAAIAKQRGL